MIRYIKGIYGMNTPRGIVIETQSGLGLEVSVPANSPLYKYREGETLMAYTSMIVKEDDISLYGFHNRESLELFEKLITVSGVGAKGALSMMSSLSSEELKRAIVFGDAKELSRANGVGKKTAERIILELKDKIGIDASNISLSGLATDSENFAPSDDGRVEAINALVALGYTKAEAFSAVSSVSDEDLSTEEYIKKALKNLF